MTTYNLATLLEEECARASPSGPPWSCRDPDGEATPLTCAESTRSRCTLSPTCWSRAGSSRGQVRLTCEPPVLHRRLLRHPQGRRRRRAAQRPAQGPRGRHTPRRLRREGRTSASRARPELPMAEAGHAGFSQVDGCGHFVVTARPRRAVTDRGVETMAQAMGGQPATFDPRRHRREDTAVILTSGTAASPGRRSCATATCATTRCSGETALRREHRAAGHLLCVLPLFLLRPDRHARTGAFAYSTPSSCCRAEAHRPAPVMLSEDLV